MSSRNVLIVESPAKAKTINKYLGSDFTVLASFGHVRDLPPKDGSVRPDEDFAMDWELGDNSKRHVDEIANAVKGAERVYLATDPDREGEAIAWHVQELLKQRKTKGVDIKRVTFNEITKSAVQAAIKNPRELDQHLIEAYLARRALDYLVGFTLSPVLWRKLPGSKSAGRVQSVALRLICERESEIEDFKAREYWSVEAIFQTTEGQTFVARLTHLNGQKLDKFSLSNEADAKAAVATIQAQMFRVSAVERKQARRNPWAPFTTSTLQQEASRKLGFGATRTMRTAQRLYEGVDIGGETVGLITYMRTDGVTLSQEAITQARQVIGKEFGDKYVPSSPRVYKTAAKNAQEAHEAIRPTDLSRRPDHVAKYLQGDELRLYELIWKRTLAAQMESAVLDQVAVDVTSGDDKVTLRATGSIVVFDGFFRVYTEDRDDKNDQDEDDSDKRLPPVKEGDSLQRGDVTPNQHFTQPPPRYTEASLVKKLEELGIGRPSTYASIMQVLQDRNYVRLDQKRFTPEDRGRVVTAFLYSFFQRYVEYSFTADLEEKLDDISGGRLEWKKVLRQFWTDFSGAIDQTKDLTITQVLDALDKDLGPHFFPETADTIKQKHGARTCPACHEGRLGLKLGRFGGFIGCSNYPTCKYTRHLTVSGEDGADAAALEGPRMLGPDPVTQLPVSVRHGPYGAYVQLGPAEDKTPPPVKVKEEPATDGKKKKTKKKKEEKEKPKRVSLPKGLSAHDLNIDTALRLLSLPREIGKHPETSQMITAGIGRFGPYLKHGPVYKSLTPDDDVLTIGLNRAVVLLAEAKTGRGRGGAPSGRELGKHPADGKPITVGAGRFGPYIKHGKIFASIPKDVSPEEFTLEQALPLLEQKLQKMGQGSAPKKAAAKTKIGKKSKSESSDKS